MLPRLTRSFHVVTYDARGHGRSAKPAAGYGFDASPRRARRPRATGSKAFRVVISHERERALDLAASHHDHPRTASSTRPRASVSDGLGTGGTCWPNRGSPDAGEKFAARSGLLATRSRSRADRYSPCTDAGDRHGRIGEHVEGEPRPGSSERYGPAIPTTGSSPPIGPHVGVLAAERAKDAESHKRGFGACPPPSPDPGSFLRASTTALHIRRTRGQIERSSRAVRYVWRGSSHPGPLARVGASAPSSRLQRSVRRPASGGGVVAIDGTVHGQLRAGRGPGSVGTSPDVVNAPIGSPRISVPRRTV